MGNISRNRSPYRCRSVHPHVRGEHVHCLGRHSQQPVHPHVRGEHRLPERISGHRDGSPPRAWGTFLSLSVLNHFTRFTPTCVGNMTQTGPAIRSPAVHPHVRGEHHVTRPLTFSAPGSPPRAWGTFEPHHLSLGRRRFTPTCVGNMVNVCLKCKMYPVHPHVRGEHWRARAIQSSSFGSPPRAWGT